MSIGSILMKPKRFRLIDKAARRHSTVDLSETIDVLVVGGGNAALCAAIAARRAGATVMLLECAPKALRGGNSRHTRNIRYLHTSGDAHLTGPYLENEFWNDLLQVTGGHTNEKLARLTIRKSASLGEWMKQQGGRFQPPLRGTLHLSRTNAHFLGGGKALMNAYYTTADKLGIKIIYDCEVSDLGFCDGLFSHVIIEEPGGYRKLTAASAVVASGGFQADLSWLKQFWGDSAENFIIRGTPYDKGRVLRKLLDHGAKRVGDPRQCHAVAVDARAPKSDGGIVTRLDCIPFGIVVNSDGQRFYDEGEDFWPKRYAIWGRLVAQQPNQTAYSIFDSKSKGEFMPSVFAAIESDSLRGLAAKLDLSASALEATVANYNKSLRPGKFDPSILDDCATTGLVPPKSHWALPLDTPPFCAYPLRPGITFTYLGVTVNERAQVIMQDDRPVPNMFAAGEIMAGNILGRGYMAGFGMTIGTVFGRIAGKEAARCARG